MAHGAPEYLLPGICRISMKLQGCVSRTEVEALGDGEGEGDVDGSHVLVSLL